MARHRTIWARGLLVSALLAAPSSMMIATRVAADCGSEGTVWPTSPHEVQGLTFTGTPVERLADTPERGAVSIRFKVDHVFAGTEGEVVLMPWCVATPFTFGERYLVSTADRLRLSVITGESPVSITETPQVGGPSGT